VLLSINIYVMKKINLKRLLFLSLIIWGTCLSGCSPENDEEDDLLGSTDEEYSFARSVWKMNQLYTEITLVFENAGCSLEIYDKSYPKKEVYRFNYVAEFPDILLVPVDGNGIGSIRGVVEKREYGRDKLSFTTDYWTWVKLYRE